MERYGDPKTVPPMDGVAVGKLLPSKAAKIESRQDALQTTFSDKNQMRRSAAVRVGAGDNQ